MRMPNTTVLTMAWLMVCCESLDETQLKRYIWKGLFPRRRPIMSWTSTGSALPATLR